MKERMLLAEEVFFLLGPPARSFSLKKRLFGHEVELSSTSRSRKTPEETLLSLKADAFLGVNLLSREGKSQTGFCCTS